MARKRKRLLAPVDAGANKRRRPDVAERKALNKASDFSVVRVSVKSFMSNSALALPWASVLFDMNKATKEASLLANLRVMLLIQGGKPIPPLDCGFFYQCLSAVSVGARARKSIQDIDLRNAVALYKSWRSPNVRYADSTNLSTGWFQCASQRWAVNTKNHILQNFYPRMKKYISQRFGLTGIDRYSLIRCVLMPTYNGTDTRVTAIRAWIPRNLFGWLDTDHPNRILPVTYRLLEFIEAENIARRHDTSFKQLKLFSLLPLKRGFQCSNFQVCKLGLRGLLRRAGIHVPPVERPRGGGVCWEDVANDWWFKLFKIKQFETATRKFAGWMEKDGKAVSIVLRRPKPIQDMSQIDVGASDVVGSDLRGAVSIPSGSASGGASGSVSFSSGSSVTETSGDVSVQSGVASGSSSSGLVSVRTGSASGSSGALSLLTGDGSTGSSGSVVLGSGASGASDAGNVTIAGGSGISAGYRGGSVLVSSGPDGIVRLTTGSRSVASGSSIEVGAGGSSTGAVGGAGVSVVGGSLSASSGAGGGISLSGGAALSSSGSSVGGDASLQGGASAAGAGGNVGIRSGVGVTSSGAVEVTSGSGVIGASGSAAFGSGDSASVSSGDVMLRSGASNGTKSGNVSILAGASSATAGSVSVSGGSSGVSTGGSVTLTSGVGASASGALSLSSSVAPGTGVSGAMSVESGGTASGASGDVRVGSGSSSLSDGGAVRLGGGSGVSATGGSVTVSGGDSSSGSSGVVNVLGGASSSSGSGGSVRVSGGSSAGGAGGGVTVSSGNSTSGVSGDVRIRSGSGGSISIIQGNSSGIGSDTLLQGGSVDSASAAQSVKIVGSGNLQGRGGDVSIDGGFSGGSVGGSVLMMNGEGATKSGAVAIASRGSALSSSSSSSGDVNVMSGHSGVPSGSVRIGSGSSTSAAGSIDIAGGASVSGGGSSISLMGGGSPSSVGGSVTIRSGLSNATESGAIGISSHNVVGSSLSGAVSIFSGSASGGGSGSVSITSGLSAEKSSGAVGILGGAGGNAGDNVSLSGGSSSASGVGGSISAAGGEGNAGGHISLAGGRSTSSIGASVRLQSGEGSGGSGAVVLSSKNVSMSVSSGSSCLSTVGSVCVSGGGCARYYEVWGIDPGRREMIVATSNSGHHMHCSSKEFYHEARYTASNKTIKHWIDHDHFFSEAICNMPTPKTTSLRNLERYVRFLVPRLDRLLDFRMKKPFRKLRFRRFLFAKKKLRKICEQLTANARGDTIVGYGDWSATDFGGVIKKCPPGGPVKTLERELKRYCHVISVPEFRTSQLHSDCLRFLTYQYAMHISKNGVKRPVKIHSVLHCRNSGCKGTTVNRDQNASKNILLQTEYHLLHGSWYPAFTP